nr:hypothetical protein [Pandoravirus aubagnensis]
MLPAGDATQPHTRPCAEAPTKRCPTLVRSGEAPKCSVRFMNTLGDFAAVLDAHDAFRPGVCGPAPRHAGAQVARTDADGRGPTLDAVARALVPETHRWVVDALVAAAAGGHVDAFYGAYSAATALPRQTQWPLGHGHASGYVDACTTDAYQAAALLVETLAQLAVDGDHVAILDRLASASLFGAGPLDLTDIALMRRAFRAASLGSIVHLHHNNNSTNPAHMGTRACCDIAMGDDAWRLPSHHVIEWARRHNCGAYRPCTKEDVAHAIRDGRATMLAWMLNNGAPHPQRGALWHAVAEAACAGHVATIDIVVGQARLLSCNWPVLIGASRGGHTTLIDWMLEPGRLPRCSCDPLPRDTLQAVLFTALSCNRQNVIEWVAARDPSLFEADVVWRAIATGSIEMVRTVEAVATAPFDWQSALLLILARSGPSLLDHALARGAKVDGALIASALPISDTHMIDYLCRAAGDEVMQCAVNLAFVMHGVRAVPFARAVAVRLPHLAFGQAIFHPHPPVPRPCECAACTDETASHNTADVASLPVPPCIDGNDTSGTAQTVGLTPPPPPQQQQQQQQEADQQLHRTVQPQEDQGDGDRSDLDGRHEHHEHMDNDIGNSIDDEVHDGRAVWTVHRLLRLALVGRRRRTHPPRDPRPRKRRRQSRALSSTIAV